MEQLAEKSKAFCQRGEHVYILWLIPLNLLPNTEIVTESCIKCSRKENA